MVDSVAEIDGIGSLRKLPQEVRLDVHRHLLPEDFLQIYISNGDRFTRVPSPHSSSLPPFLRVSKELHSEMLPSLMADRTCEARIANDIVRTNFFMHDPWSTIGSQQLNSTQEVTLRIPLCKRLTVTIVPPSPADGRRLRASTANRPHGGPSHEFDDQGRDATHLCPAGAPRRRRK